MLEQHTLSNQSAQLTRGRNYVEDFELVIRQPRDAPEWTFTPQNIPTDTDFSMPNTPGALGDEALGDEVLGDDKEKDELRGGFDDGDHEGDKDGNEEGEEKGDGEN
jgi:hypothetical protein